MGEGDLPACPQETRLSSLVKGILGLKAWGGKSGPGVGATGSSWVLSKCRQYLTSRQALRFPTCPAFQDALKGQSESAHNLGPEGSSKGKYITPVLLAHGVFISHLGDQLVPEDPGRLSRSQYGSSDRRRPSA